MPGRGRVEVTGGFLLLMAWLNYCDRQNLLPLAICAAAAHETGHWAAIRLLGGQIRRLRLSAAGAELQMDGALSYGREFLCALAGPSVNIVLALAAAYIGKHVFAGINLALALFNLLPVSALDGGRALSCLVSYFLGPNAAHRMRVGVDGVACVALGAVGAVLLGMGGSVTMLVVAMWLLRAFYRNSEKLGGKKGCQGAAERVK